MGKVKRILHKILFPGSAVVIFSIPVGVGLLIYTFLCAGEQSPIAYTSYVASAYSLVIVCIRIIPMIRSGKKWIYQNPYLGRYFQDIPFKLQLSLYLSLAVNLFYVGLNGLSGIYYHSVWFGTLAAYYIFLTVLRFLLVRYAHRQGFGENLDAEWRRYRLCGMILILMNLALAGVAVLVLYKNESFEYAGFLIYAVALYTFYTMIMAVINVVKYRKYRSPVMSAAKTVNLAAALVSMLSLEVAMLTQFKAENDSPYFRELMIGSTGGAVCAIVVGMGIYMIVNSTRQLRNNNSET